ncbi:MAG TPA: oligosaccharide flippase family protein [Bacteroidia bacterium]|nr:oligosaccharide flippase family protein [Bacteroidia bacterium]
MGTLKKLAGQSAVYGLSSIVGRFLNYLLVPLHTNIFKQPGEYGVVTEIYAYISFLAIIYTYGLETSFFNFSRQEPFKEKIFSTVMTSVLTTTLLFSGTIIYFSGSLADLMHYQKHPEYIIWMAMIIGFDALTAIPFAKLRQENKARKFAMLKLTNILINIGFNLLFFIIFPVWSKLDSGAGRILADTFYNPDIRVGYVFISNLLASAITFFVMIPDIKFRFSEYDRALLGKVLLYSSPLLIAGLAGMVNETLDRIMIKYLIPDTRDAMRQLGIYGACYKLSILMTLFIQAFRYAAEPFFFSHFKGDDSKHVYARVMKYFVMACAFIFLFIMMYIDVFKYFIGKNYWEGLSVVPLLLVANMCLGVFFNLSMWYKLSGKTQYGAMFSVFGAVLTIALNLMLVPAMGYKGAAWATLICYASMMVLSFIIGQKKFFIPYQTKRILMIMIISVCLYLLSSFLKNITGTQAGLVVNTLILGFFIYILYKFEKPPLPWK